MCTGVPQPVAVLDKHAAAAGIAIVTGQLGSTVGTAALVAEWAKGTVLKVSLGDDGTDARGKATVLFTGVTNPVALTLTKGGSLLGGRLGLGPDLRDHAPDQQPMIATATLIATSERVMTGAKLAGTCCTSTSSTL